MRNDYVGSFDQLSFLICARFVRRVWYACVGLVCGCAVKVLCLRDSVRGGKSSWQVRVDYRVSLYCHKGWNSGYVTFGQCGKTLLTKLLMLLV
jgi:hypothetical protein